MNAVDLILKKRNSRALEPEEIQDLIAAYTAGTVPDYQMSAFLMAAFLNGMSDREAVALTHSMLHSGDVLDLSDVPGRKVDKHSTGGVGDKISLILAPLVAACGVPVPMISGRGLGHTGGTLDKLESIPGFNTQLDIDAYRRQLRDLGIVMIGQTREIAPADRKLYALRDVTGTVEFIPFIAASIMSKKLAEGIDALVLDVKSGRGAFMKDENMARELAETLVGIGERFGKPTVAWMTDMSSPLGRTIGNWPEVAESIRCLRGEDVPDLMEVSLMLSAEMVVLGGVATTIEEAMVKVKNVLRSGQAFEKFRELVARQGGSLEAVDHPERRSEAAKKIDVLVPAGGGPYVESIDAFALGRAAVRLGAGRLRKEAPVDPLAGITLHAVEGDRIVPGEILATIGASDLERAQRIEKEVQDAFSWGKKAAGRTSRLLNRYANGQWLHPIGVPSV